MKKLLITGEDIEEIYNAGDSGREGEYIQRSVFMMAKPNPKAKMKRVWIDSQTEDEILRGINEAKDLAEYDSLSNSAYLRAKEDYLICINFSRLLSIIFGRKLAQTINEEKASISIGRVMTCVLGWVAVLIGAVIMKFTDIRIIDPILSIGVALFIVINALKTLKEIVDTI